MTNTQLARILKIAEEEGIEDVHAWNNGGGYSGRGMFGKTTLAVVIPYKSLAEEFAERLRKEDHTLPKNFGFRLDSMGKDYIIY